MRWARTYANPAKTMAALGRVVATALDALESGGWLPVGPNRVTRRIAGRACVSPSRWTSRTSSRVERPDPNLPELFVGPPDERRERLGFSLTDKRMSARAVEQEIDYCMLCHDRDKDSCSKGLVEPKSEAYKKNALGVALEGCPLEEKISEMHAMRQAGELVAALSIIIVDNPMCPGTGHRICNDCMKACIFQKQEPVNIPEVETRVVTEVLALPWGLEVYQFLTRWNPLNVKRPFMRPYCGKNVLVVGLGPAGYTLVHHLACEGFGVVAIDGLKVEPIDPWLLHANQGGPVPIKDAADLFGDLGERKLLGFGESANTESPFAGTRTS